MPGGKWIFQHPILYFGLFFCDVVYSICFDHLLKTFVSYYLPCDSFTWWLLYINVVCVICTWPRWYVRHLFHAKPRGSFRGGLSWWHSRGLLQVRTALLCRWVNACCCIGCVCGWLFLLLLLWWLLWLKLICLMFVLQLFLLLMLLHRPAGCNCVLMNHMLDCEELCDHVSACALRRPLHLMFCYLMQRCVLYPACRRRINLDFSNIPDDQPYADKVFVDFINKKYWIDR